MYDYRMININMRTRIYFILTVLVIFISLSFWWYIAKQGQSYDLRTYRSQLAQESKLFNYSMKRQAVISDLLVKNPLIINMLSRQSLREGTTSSDDINIRKILNLVAETQGVSAAYLLDKNGTCIYSSRTDFIGHNYAFRPYFSKAMASGSALYAAVGVTSKQLGLYYGQIIGTAPDAPGVMVIKFLPALDFLHSLYGRVSDSVSGAMNHTTGILTDSGILVDFKGSKVFSLEELQEKSIKELEESRQFPPGHISSFHFPSGTLIRLQRDGFLEQENAAGIPYLLFLTHPEKEGFPLVHVIKRSWFYDNFNPISEHYRIFLLFSFVSVVLLCLLLFILNQRHRQSLVMAASLERETRKTLEEQKKFETIINESPGGFWLCEHDTGNVLMVNPSLCRLFDRKENEILGRNSRQFLSQKGLVLSEKAFHEKGASASFESQVSRNNGDVCDVLIHSSCFTDAGTGEDCCFAFFTDITEQKKQRQRLELFSKIIEQMSSSLVITDTSGKILYTNPFFSRITGYSRDEARGKNPSILQSGETDPAVYKKLWSTILRGGTWKGYLENRKKDGSMYWEGASIFPVFDEQGKISHFVAIKNDITKRIRLERKVASQAAQHELIIQHAEIGLSLILDHKFVWSNRAGTEMFGYRDHKMVRGMSTAKIFSDYETFQEVTSRAADCFLRGETFSEELLMRRAGGNLFWCRITGKIIDRTDFSQGAIWLTEDISQQRDQQQLLVEARDQARQASQAKSSFLANMSHEIRTPMNAIIGMSRLMRETELDSRQQYLVETVLNSSQFLLGLINDILDFSKIESGRLDLNNKPFSVAACVMSVIRDSSVLATEKGLLLEHNINPAVPDYVIGDEMRMRQILINLVGNGIKFTEKGSVDILVKPCAEDAGIVCLQFQVLDTGIGVDMEKKSAIFQEFRQADSTIASEFGGTGLGLTISSQLCELMGGELTVDSVPGEGSCFTATVHFEVVSSAEYAELEATSVIDEVNLPALDILVVDDNEANRYLAHSLFKQKDHRIFEASSGLEALNILVQHDVDVVLMDIRMPQLNGLLTTRIIRACEHGEEVNVDTALDSGFLETLRDRLHGRHLPIIALTANAMEEDRLQCLEAGMDEYASKPFAAAEIYQALWAVLPPGKRMDVSSLSPSASVLPAQESAEKKTSVAGNERLERVRTHLQETYGLEADEVEKMCRLSADSLADACRQANDALADKDMDALAAAAHKAKGGLLALGLEQESDTARLIEAGARSNQDCDYPQMVRKLTGNIKYFIDAYTSNKI